MQRDKADIRSLIAGVLADAPETALWEIDRRRLWGRVALVAWQQRIGGVLLARLRELDASIPAEAHDELSAYAAHVREANRFRIARVLPVIDALADAGARCVVLKGAALLASIYRDASLRPMVDVDLLVDGSQLDMVESVLDGAGWIPGAELVRRDFFPRFHYEREYVTRDEPRVRIDLHVRPFRPLRFATTIPSAAFLDGVQPREFRGQVIHIPDREMMLIHLSAHAALHGASELRWLYDIHCWLCTHGASLDLRRVVERCRAWRLDAAIRFALTRVESAFGASRSLAALLAEFPRRGGLSDRLVLWQAPHGDSRHATDVFVNALTTQGWRRRLAYLSAVLLPDAAHLQQIYPHRHFGWPVAAHATRAWRVVTRPLPSSKAS